jgi:hypothetical protein
VVAQVLTFGPHVDGHCARTYRRLDVAASNGTAAGSSKAIRTLPKAAGANPRARVGLIQVVRRDVFPLDPRPHVQPVARRSGMASTSIDPGERGYGGISAIFLAPGRSLARVAMASASPVPSSAPAAMWSGRKKSNGSANRRGGATGSGSARRNPP